MSTKTSRVSPLKIRFDPKEYEESIHRTRGSSYVSETEISDILELSDIAADSRLLEVGFGTGRVLRRLVNTNATLVGIDADLRMVKHLANSVRTKCESSRTEIHLVVASGDYLPFRENAFTAVLCVRVLRYFDKPQTAVAEMSRVIVPSGKLVLEFANFFRPQSILQIPSLFQKKSLYPRLFTRKDLTRWASEGGLRITKFRSWHKIPAEIVATVNSSTILAFLSHLEYALQRVSPPEFLSRSIVLSAVRTSEKRTDQIAWGTFFQQPAAATSWGRD